MTYSRSLLLGLSSALLISLSLRPWGLGLLAFVAFVPLLFSLWHSRNVVHPIIACYAAALGISVIAFEGVGARYLAVYPLLILTQAGWFVLAGLAYWLIYHKHGRTVALVTFPFIWVAAEYLPSLRLLWGINANPLMKVGYSQFDLPFMKLASIGGVPLISLVIIVINLITFRMFLIPKKWVHISVVSSAIVGVVSLSMFRSPPDLAGLNHVQRVGSGDVALEVAIVQGNISNIDFVLAEYDEGLRREILEHYRSLANSASVTVNPELFVWPETAIPGVIEVDEPAESLLDALNTSSLTIAGAIIKDGAYHSNSAIVFDQGKLSEVYRKRALVPVFESSWIEAGNQHSSIVVNGMRVGVAICLDTVFPSLFRDAVLDGAEVFVVLSSSTFAGPTATPELHLRTAAFRAIEYRRPVVFASQSGPSGVVAADGQVVLRTRKNESAVLLASVAAERSISYYARFGDWAGILSMIISLTLPVSLSVVEVISQKFALSDGKLT